MLFSAAKVVTVCFAAIENGTNGYVTNSCIKVEMKARSEMIQNASQREKTRRGRRDRLVSPRLLLTRYLLSSSHLESAGEQDVLLLIVGRLSPPLEHRSHEEVLAVSVHCLCPQCLG